MTLVFWYLFAVFLYFKQFLLEFINNKAPVQK